MKGRNAQVSRIYRVIGILEGAPHGLTVSELADRMVDRGFEVGKRTVYRDLEALQAAGFPLELKGQSDEQASRWTLERNARVGDYLALSSRELLALYMARSVLLPLEQTPFYQDLQTIFQKIEDKLGNKAQSYLEEISQELRFEPGPKWGLGLSPDVIDTVRAACTENHVLQMTYHSVNSGNRRTRRVGPQFLYMAKGSLYLVAEDLEDSVIKVFSCTRMSELVMLDEQYQGQEINPEEFFRGSIGVYRGENPERVVVRVSPTLASFVRERRWHTSQTVVAREGGSIDVTLEVAITPELLQWVLGFGAHAEVLEPESLRKLMAAEADKLLSLYEPTKRKVS